MREGQIDRRRERERETEREKEKKRRTDRQKKRDKGEYSRKAVEIIETQIKENY